MSKFKFATLAYSTINLGDDIQTVATLPYLNHPSISFDRDSLALQESEDKIIILMNAWWAANPENAFPPANCFLPVFIGFHIAASFTQYFSQPKCVAYLKTHAPIGCRDVFTMNILQQMGVDTFFSGCLSTTFEKRESEPVNGKIIMVDTARVDYLIPLLLKKEAIVTTHAYTGDRALRENAVNDLMHLYRTTASLIITTRLHSALTCSAIGIPVVFFFNPEDPRASSAEQIGLPLYQYQLSKPPWLKKYLRKLRLISLWRWYEVLYFKIRYRFFYPINWNPDPLDIEKHKSILRSKTAETIEAILHRAS